MARLTAQRIAIALACSALVVVGPAGNITGWQTPSPEQNLPPHIRQLTRFGERAEFSLDGRRVLFLSKTFGDAMEVEIDTGIIRNLTSHYPHYGYTRALYLSNGDILLSGPTEFNPENTGQARTNSWLFVLKP